MDRREEIGISYRDADREPAREHLALFMDAYTSNHAPSPPGLVGLAVLDERAEPGDCPANDERVHFAVPS